MSLLPSTRIRTIALLGHGAAGKTTLAESLLAATGAITSRGAVEKGNSTCDFDPLEKEFGHSLQTALVSMQWDDARLHLIDTPRIPRFCRPRHCGPGSRRHCTDRRQRPNRHRIVNRAYVCAGRRARAMPYGGGQQD